MFSSLAFFALLSAQASDVNTVDVDAREAGRSLFHVSETLRVKPGPLELAYPRFIPGEHGPTGPLNSIYNFYVLADGKPLDWNRDQVDMFTVHVTVPDGVQSIVVKFDQNNAAGGFFGNSSSALVSRLKWNRLVWYPFAATDGLKFQASVTLPKDWGIATALTEKLRDGDTVRFEAESLTTLVDSPLQIGRYHAEYDVTGKSPVKHSIAVMADSQAAVDSAKADISKDGRASFLDSVRRLHEEAEAMTGAQHYRSYRWLLSLSDEGASDGLEHHECSEDGVDENSIVNPSYYFDLGDLLCHEYFHSFNGKFRRPGGLCTPEFRTPMRDELLWVYEGMTQFYGEVLEERAGFSTPEQFREMMAFNYDHMNSHKGRNWRPLADTAVAAQLLYGSGNSFVAARRLTDYYTEMTLVWLEVDQKIRDLTKNSKSLDDFSRLFHGGASNGIEVKPYTFEEVVATLNQVAPYDWASLLRERVYTVQPTPTTEGLTAAGWRISYNETPNVAIAFAEGRKEPLWFADSTGLFVKDGVISDVVPGSPADKAGLAPSMKITAVNARRYDPDLLKAATGQTAHGTPLELTVESQGFTRTVKLDYAGGLRYPHLVRIEDKPDRLADLLKPLSK